MNTRPLARRTVLRGLGGAAIALPWLDIMARPGVARAEASLAKTGIGGNPKRFLVLFTPCGHGPDWFRNSSGADGKLALAPALKPLERHKDTLLFLNGVDLKSAITDRSGVDGGHFKPMANLLTAVPTAGGKGGGISIDQAIAKEIGKDTKFPSLQLSVQNVREPLGYKASWTAAGVPLVPTTDPQRVFTKLFSDLQSDPLALARTQAERKSVLDGIKEDYTDFFARIGAQDREKVSVHLDAIREVEKTLTSQTAGASGAGICHAPAVPAKYGYTSADYITNSNAHLDLIAMALACDFSRVFTMLYEGAGGNIKLPGLPRGIHDASHDYGAGGWPDRNKFTEWYATTFAAFFDKLKNIKEAGGASVYDNTVIYWCTEHGAGNHNYDRLPLAVAGGCGGHFKMGRQVNYPNNSDGLGFCQTGCGAATGPGHGELYVSFLNAMGLPATSFGVPALCRGPLPGLTA